MTATRSANLAVGILGLASLCVAACSLDAGPKEPSNTVGSAGNKAGGAGAAPTAALPAAPSSDGFLGNRVSAALDDDDKRRAYAAQLRALETGPSGAPVTWRNPDSGRYGNVVPGPVYQLNGAPCRQYTHTVYVDGQPQTVRGTACRNPDGAWSTNG
jgi:surface antigen